MAPPKQPGSWTECSPKSWALEDEKWTQHLLSQQLGENLWLGSLNIPSASTSAAVSGYLWDKKEVLWPPVVMQQGSGDSIAELETSLSTGWEEGKEGKQTAAPQCLLNCGLEDFISKGKTPSAIQNFPEGSIIIG